MINFFLKLFKWFFVLFLLVGGLSWFVFNVGESGWIAASKAWSNISIIAIAVKYVIAAIVAIYWRELCTYAGVAFRNTVLWSNVANNGRVFLVVFVVMEIVGQLG